MIRNTRWLHGLCLREAESTEAGEEAGKSPVKVGKI